MDSFRLLSCSTNLKPREAKPSGVPVLAHLSTNISSGKPPSKKRKRDSSEHQIDEAAGGEATATTSYAAQTGRFAAKNGTLTPADRNAVLPSIPAAESRLILKRHSIKITDLRALHSSNARPETKKHQKEAARLFPPVLSSFKQLRIEHKVNHALADNIADQGYYEPTEVQLATIPLLLGAEGTEPDLLTIAPTGSGKTIAFLIPLIQKICGQHQEFEDKAGSRHVGAIIVAPTKELVGQIVNEGRKLTARSGVTITAMKKGMHLHTDQENNDLQRYENSNAEGDQPKPKSGTLVKTDILVSTPLSIVHAISSTSSSTLKTLPSITNLVLDEADVLLDPLFRDQTQKIWSACTNSSLRTSFWSATIGSNIESLAINTITSRRKNLKISKSDQAPLLRVVVGLKDSALPASIIHKLIYAATETGKLLGLRQLLHPPSPHLSAYNQKSIDKTKSDPTHLSAAPLRPPFLVFTQTIPRATALHHELLYDLPPPPSSDPKDSRIAVLHSDLSDTHRAEIMSRFRKGQVWVLITTDLLSRGVDFRGVNVVVNYDIPNTSAAYVHRAGRTGRQAGTEGRRRDGTCVTFYTKEDIKYVRNIANVIAQSQKGRANEAATSTQNSRTSAAGLEPWLLAALPPVSRKDRKDLKQHGVEARRAQREEESKDVAKMKRKARIGTVSGYDKKAENNRRGAIEGSLRRGKKNARSGGGSGSEDDGEGEWDGISD